MSDALARVHERLDELFSTIAEARTESTAEIRQLAGEVAGMRSEVAAITAVIPDTRNRIEQHARTLYGFNSDPGLVGQVHEVKADGRRREKVVAGVIGSIAAGVAAITATVVSWLVS